LKVDSIKNIAGPKSLKILSPLIILWWIANMAKHVLLVEPDYYTRYPPLGLLKISSYHKNKGATTELVRGITRDVSEEPDVVYVTSLFTWAWEPVWKAIQFYSGLFPNSELWLGGLYASLMPKHAALSGISPDHIFKGIFSDAEDLLPDYSLVPEWNEKVGGSIVFASRGCVRSCKYCAVPQLEGYFCAVKKSIRNLIWPRHKRIIFFDNNFFANPNWENVLQEVKEFDLRVDFNQGLDARLLSEKVAKKISQLKLDKFVRLSYDYRQMRPYVKKVIGILKSHGIDGRKILVYALYNFTDGPQDLFDRIKDVLSWGAVCYPMRYQPLNTLVKNRYIAPEWDEIKLDAVQRARRVIGSGGAFPPYEGMLRVKVENCNTFSQAFGEFMTELEKIQ
jgi:hypothetical protein